MPKVRLVSAVNAVPSDQRDRTDLPLLRPYSEVWTRARKSSRSVMASASHRPTTAT